MSKYIISTIIVLAILVLLVSIRKYILIQTTIAKENKVIIKSKKVKNEIRITQISDFHSNTLKNLEYVLERIRKFKPHFIILTGDINDYGEINKFNKAVYLLENLSSLNIKSFYITGNHEERGGMTQEFINEVKKNDIYYLHNSGVEFSVDNNKLYIYGTGFYDFSYENFKPQPDTINIVLSHFSKMVRDQNDGREDFVFSGHTHGGQVRVPFIGAIYAPNEGFFPNYSQGVYEYNGIVFHVDSGLGNTKWNLRTLDQIQFSNITIKECQ